MPFELPDRRTLPLFPLNTVLFPGASLPLQIFEERYKRLLQDCLDSDERFGIVLIKSGDEVGQPAIPHPIGTVAHITQVNEMRGDRFLIAVTGERRFKINTITQHRPYITADVSILPDVDSEEARPESESILRQLNEYLSLITGLQGGWTSEVRTSRDPAALSYFIAETLLIDLSEKQQLLEKPSTVSRLEAEAEVLRRDIDQLRERVAVELRAKFSRQ
ncbi:MAG: peptidase S16 [Chloroflexi bacterium]|nr:peptidase S16 [Chloroflexota bacterium]